MLGFANCSICRDSGLRRSHPRTLSVATRGGWPTPMRGSDSSPSFAINELPKQLESNPDELHIDCLRIEPATHSYCLRKRTH